MERAQSVGNTSQSTSTSSMRGAVFSEAVPLSLSSMAHASFPLEDGVLDGVKQVIQHTLLSCVNYARILHPPHQWTFRDVMTSPHAWIPVKGTGNQVQYVDHHHHHKTTTTTTTTNNINDDSNNEEAAQPQQQQPSTAAPSDLPFALSRLHLKHGYTRNAFLYLRPALGDGDSSQMLTAEQEVQLLQHNQWTQQPGILGRISLQYVSKEPLTAGELDGTDTEDMPPTILYKVIVEYRSLPATGNQQAVQAEELAMLSFGGSLDDDVKYGALAALYDPLAKYVLEIYSVRGKKYKFDLMDATLSDGTVPRLPQPTTNNNNSAPADPFVKSLCATVTDHSLNFDTESTMTGQRQDDSNNNNNNNPRYAVTRLHLTLEGKLRRPPGDQQFENLPPFDAISKGVQDAFLLLNPKIPSMITATPSGHTLLLHPALAGRVYVNGRYVTTWGDAMDPRVASHGMALFGMDLHSIPFWNGRIVDYVAMKHAYATLWHELLVDARLAPLDLAGKLLQRLMMGQDVDNDDDMDDEYDDDNDDDDDDDDEYNDDHDMDDGNNHNKKQHYLSHVDVNSDCLEAQVMASSLHDPVGIASKALATKFAVEYGTAAFPCLPYEFDHVQRVLPGRHPVAVPQRVIHVLRRGGYFDVQRTLDDLWFATSRPIIVPPVMMTQQQQQQQQSEQEGSSSSSELELVLMALQLLEDAGLDPIVPEQIVIAASPCTTSKAHLIRRNGVCRFNTVLDQFSINDQFFALPPEVLVEHLPPGCTSFEHVPYSSITHHHTTTGETTTTRMTGIQRVHAHVLASCLAREHPDGNMLYQYMRHAHQLLLQPSSSTSSSAAQVTNSSSSSNSVMGDTA